VICGGCGHANPERARFCLECGAPLAQRCAACATELPANAKFCLECGAPVAPGAARRERATSDTARRHVRPAEAAGARKVVSIVFADLVGSTALHERLDPESARGFMEGYYAAMRGVVDAHGGSVTQLLGDGVKAMFGVPRVAEDDALRAVRAAVAMQHAFRNLAERYSAQVGKTGLRIAVNTGEVVVSDDSEIIGDPVNVAARLQEQGRDGDVVIGDATARLVGALVTLVPLGSFALKGRAEPVAAFRVQSLDRPEGSATAAFVGRDDELARMTRAYDAAVATPATRLVVLLGSPGLGKSRLIDEFAARRGDRATVIAAHCNAAGGATFAPLADALRTALDVEDGAGGEVLRVAIDDALAGRVADVAERARIAAGIGGLLGGSPAPPEETFFVVRRFLAALAGNGPVVLVIDDLHWAEPLLLDLVEHLVQWGAGVPLLVLVGARPELRDVRSSLATPGGVVAAVVTLGGLDAGAAMRLAANVIGAADLPAAVAAKVLATSEGNPLFVGELVRMLVQEGALTREGERWTTGAGLASLEMPPTIHALLAARIERLESADRSVLECAAVVGRHFSRSAVAALLADGVDDLDARLESLQRSELIERDAGWLLGEPVLRFHHVLIRDAAYRRLLKGTRAELHARFADWIGGRTADAAEHDETIGWHLEQAHQHLRELGPLDDAGRALGARASQHLAAAGRRALARDDVPLAAGLLGRAVATLDADDPARAELALDWCEALLAAGDVGPAASAIAQLERFCIGSDRLAAWHACFAAQLKVLTAPEELRAAAGAVAAATDRLTALDDASGQATGHYVHALALARLGQVGACEGALDRALAAARRAGDRRRANTVLAIAPLAALWGPSPVARASGRCLDVVRVLRITQGAPAVEAVALSCQGVLEALRGRTDAARRMIASARKMVEELGITQRLLEADAFAGLVDLLDGDPSSAERSLRRAYDGLRVLGLGIDAARAAALLARALLAQGRVDEAEALSHDSEALAGDDLKAAIAWRGVRAEALARRGEHATAVELASRAVEIAAATDALLDHADARTALAVALRAARRGAEADAEERRALELWEAKGATLLFERARHPSGHLDVPPESIGSRAAGASAGVGAPALPVARRIRPNAAQRDAERDFAAIASRDLDALMAAHTGGLHVVHHPTGATYGAPEAIAMWRGLWRTTNLVCRQDVLATLGDSLVLVRRSFQHDGVETKLGSIGPVKGDFFCLLEIDGQEPPARRSEIFAEDRLGEAIARLYERHAELDPAADEVARAAATAQSIATMMAVAARGEVDRLASALSPAVESLDHRQLGLPPARGAGELLRDVRALFDLAADIVISSSDVLGLEEHALLQRISVRGTDRSSGGVFELPVLLLWAFADDGLLARWEVFDAEREPQALARFAEILGEAQVRPTTLRPAPDPTRRRVMPNAGSAAMARGGAMGTLSASLLAADRLGEAVVELYARHAATLPEGPLRARATATAGAIAAMVAPPDLGRYASALSPSVEFKDHRTVGFAAGRGADNLLRGFASLLELASNVTTRVDDVLCLEPGAMLLRWSTSGIDRRTGGAFESSFLLLWIFGADGRIAHDETFDAEREGDALARYDELVRGVVAHAAAVTTKGAPPTTAMRRERETAATRSIARFAEVVVARDAEALAAMLSEKLAFVHHPTATTYGRREMLKTWRSLFHAGHLTWSGRSLTSLGDALALDRHVVIADGFAEEHLRPVGAVELEEIGLWEIDERGLGLHLEVFAPDRLGDAVIRLYERHATLLAAGPERDRATAIARTLATAVRPADLDAWCAAIADDFDLVDHRVLGVGSLRGGDAMRANFRAMFALEDHVATGVVDVLATRPDAIVVRLGNSGVARDSGGTYERWFLQLAVFDRDGLLGHMEYFDHDRDADALARFDELTALGSERSAPTAIRLNAASRARAQVNDAFLSRDWDRMRALASAVMRYADRRRWAMTSGDVEMWLKSSRTVQFASDVAFRDEVIATVGERIDLRRRILTGTADGGAFESEFILLTEVDAGGKLLASINFDVEAQAEASLEAQQRRLASDEVTSGGHQEVANAATRLNERLARAWEARDWDTIAALHAPSHHLDDRRRLMQMRLSATDAMAQLRVLFDVPGSQWVISPIATRGERLSLSRYLFHGDTDAGGGPLAIDYLAVDEVDGDGRFAEIVLFDPDDLDTAYAELHARFAAGEAAPQPFANAATASTAPVIHCLMAHDWEGFRQLFSESFHMSDRRRVVQLELDREQYVAFTREVADGRTVRNRWEMVATRGDRLAVTRSFFEFADADVGPSEIAFLLLMEVDECYRIAADVRWDLDDLDAAHAELDARWAAGEGAAHPVELKWLADYERCFAARDWDGMAAILAPDLRSQSHRLVSWGTVHGPAGLLSTIQAQMELAPDTQVRVAHRRVCARGLLLDYTWHGTRDGGAFEMAFTTVVELDGSGRARRIDVWEAEQLEHARARFAELQGSAPRPSRATIGGNAATALADRWQLFDGASDTGWDELRASCAPEIAFEDRQGFAHVQGDRELMIASLRERAASGARAEREVLAIAGERVAVTRMLWSGGPADGRFEIEYLGVTEVDASGRLTATILFGADDERPALREAWARWAAIEPDVATTVALVADLGDAWSARDRARIRALCTEDLAYDDRRRTGIGQLAGADAFVASLDALWQLAPATEIEWGRSWLACARHGGITVVRRFGTLPDGGPFESEHLELFVHADGRATHLELFDLDDLDRALARFAELRAAAEGKASP